MEHAQVNDGIGKKTLGKEWKLLTEAMKIFYDKHEQLEKFCQEQSQSLSEMRRIFLDYVQDQLCSVESENLSALGQPNEKLRLKSNENIKITVNINKIKKNSEHIGERYLNGAGSVLKHRIQALNDNWKCSENIRKQLEVFTQREKSELGQQLYSLEKKILAAEQELLTYDNIEGKVEQLPKNYVKLSQENECKSQVIGKVEECECQCSQLLHLLADNGSVKSPKNYVKLSQENECKSQVIGKLEECECQCSQLLHLLADNGSVKSPNKEFEEEVNCEIEEDHLLKALFSPTIEQKDLLEGSVKRTEVRQEEKSVFEEQLNKLKIKYFDRQETIEREKKSLQREKLEVENELKKVIEEKKQANDLNRKYNSLREECSLINSQAEKINVEKRNLEENLKQFKDLNQQEKSEKNVLQEHLSSVQQEKLAVDQERSALKEQLSELKMENSLLRKNCNEFEVLERSLIQEKSDLDEELQQLQGKLSKAMDDLETERNSFQKAKLAMESELAAVTAERNELKAQLREREEYVNALGENNKKLENSENRQQKTIIVLRNKIKGFAKETKNLNRQFRQLEGKHEEAVNLTAKESIGRVQSNSPSDKVLLGGNLDRLFLTEKNQKGAEGNWKPFQSQQTGLAFALSPSVSFGSPSPSFAYAFKSNNKSKE
ncbi:uncharacterized protein ACN427_002553 isoform 1-T2 [Glossina fuscipes fuscipes]